MDFQIVTDLIAAWAPKILIFIGVFSTIATITPNKTDDKIVQFLLDLVNFLGGNVGKAANKPDA